MSPAKTKAIPASVPIKVGYGSKKYRLKLLKTKGKNRPATWIGGVIHPEFNFAYDTKETPTAADVIQWAVFDAVCGVLGNDAKTALDNPSITTPSKADKEKKEAIIPPKILSKAYNMVRKMHVINSIDINVWVKIPKLFESITNDIKEFISYTLHIEDKTNISIKFREPFEEDDLTISCIALATGQLQE